MHLLLVGCTGFVGRELLPLLLKAGHDLTVVSRKGNFSIGQEPLGGNLSFLQVDPSDATAWEEEPLLSALRVADGVVNLAGEPIAEQRWTVSHCKRLEESRLVTTTAMVRAMGKLRKPPKVLINASAIGYYGTSLDSHFTETSPAGNDFLARLCERWEAAAANKPSRTRLVVMRIGIVLESDGGALGKMLPIFRAGFGGPIGSGLQWMSWIHRSDLCELIKKAIENKSWSGVFNAVSPQPISMATFAATLGKTLGRPSLLPVPGPFLKVLLGDGARVVLEGQFVCSDRLRARGFSFLYSDLTKALEASIN